MQCQLLLFAITTLANIAMQSDASKSQVFSLKITVETESGLLTGGGGTDFVPLEDAFLYVLSLKEVNANRNLSPNPRRGMRDWIITSGHSKTQSSKSWSFSEENRRILPPRVIIRVEDEIRLNLNDREYIGLSLFLNSPPSRMLPDPSAYASFTVAEPLPVKVSHPLNAYVPAWALILDHDLARLTNEKGVVEFAELPVGMDIPFRLVYPPFNSRKDIEIEIDDKKMVEGARFVTFSNDSSPRELRVRVRRRTPSEIQFEN